jgi:hypothetical protein
MHAGQQHTHTTAISHIHTATAHTALAVSIISCSAANEAVGRVRTATRIPEVRDMCNGICHVMMPFVVEFERPSSDHHHKRFRSTEFVRGLLLHAEKWPRARWRLWSRGPMSWTTCARARRCACFQRTGPSRTCGSCKRATSPLLLLPPLLMLLLIPRAQVDREAAGACAALLSCSPRGRASGPGSPGAARAEPQVPQRAPRLARVPAGGECVGMPARVCV